MTDDRELFNDIACAGEHSSVSWLLTLLGRAAAATDAAQVELRERLEWELPHWQERAMTAERANQDLLTRAHIAESDLAAAQERISALEREQRDFHMDYRMKCDQESKAALVRAETAEAQVEALSADARHLRDALRLIANMEPRMLDQKATVEHARAALSAAPATERQRPEDGTGEEIWKHRP